jgi:hypothetical protein
MRAGGDREALRLLMCDRDNAVASAKTARTILASVIVTAPTAQREQLRHIADGNQAKPAAPSSATSPATCTAPSTASRIQALGRLDEHRNVR